MASFSKDLAPDSCDIKLTKLSISKPNSTFNSGETFSASRNFGSFSPTFGGYMNENEECLPPRTFNGWPTTSYSKPTSPPPPSQYSYYSFRSVTPCCANSSYQYRSSSMATVFGGRKPLISPSRLSTSINSEGRTTMYLNPVCNCQQMNLAYAGGESSYIPMTPSPSIISSPSYREQPFTRSSSQSSGFGSQGNLTPPPQQLSWSTQNFQTRQKSVFPNFTRGETKARGCPLRIKQEVEEVIFSDEEEEVCENYARPKTSEVRRRLKAPKSKIRNLSQAQKESSEASSNQTAGYKFFMQLLLRAFLFINVLLFFCVFFVGKWPEPLDIIVEKAYNLYGNVFEFLMRFLVNIENSVNQMLTYVCPDSTEIPLGEDVIKELLFEGN